MTDRKKILIVDDEKDLLTFMTTLFNDWGYEPLTALDGLECMEKARSEKPDLITLDMTMPRQSGVKTFRELKDSPDLAVIPVIIITAIGDNMEEFLSKRRQVPAPEGFMTKPIDQKALIEMVRGLIGEGGGPIRTSEKN